MVAHRSRGSGSGRNVTLFGSTFPRAATCLSPLSRSSIDKPIYDPPCALCVRSGAGGPSAAGRSSQPSPVAVTTHTGCTELPVRVLREDTIPVGALTDHEEAL